jgi:hypothetical protein
MRLNPFPAINLKSLFIILVVCAAIGCGHGRHDHADKNVIMDVTIVLNQPVDSRARDSVLLSLQKYFGEYLAEQTKIDPSKIKFIFFEQPSDQRLFRCMAAITGSTPHPPPPPPPPIRENINILIDNLHFRQVTNLGNSRGVQ